LEKPVWSFTRFSGATIHYFLVDCVAVVVPATGILILEFVEGFEAVAYLSVALLVYRLSRVFSWVIFVVYASVLAESYESQPEVYSRGFRDSLVYTLLFQGLVTIALATFAMDLITPFFGASYSVSSFLLIPLLMGGVFDAFYQVCASVLRTSYQSKALLIVNAIVLLVNISSVILFVYMFSTFGAAISFAVTVMCQGLSASIFLIYNKQSLPETMNSSRVIGLSMSWSFFVILVVYIQQILYPIWSIQIFLFGSIGYILLGRVLHLFTFKDIFHLFKSLLKTSRY
jgi:O-antigen/teichoic acid export membrane protein